MDSVPVAHSYHVDHALLSRLERDLALRERTAVVRVCPTVRQPITISYNSFGSESDPCVLLVMGLNSQGIVWDTEFCELLAKRGPFFVVRYDNRDTGFSTRLDSLGKPSLVRTILPRRLWERDAIPYTLNDMAEDGVALLDHLRVRQAHVVGVSMGGMIAQLIAAYHPIRVLSLTSIMSHCGSRDIEAPTLWTKLHFLRKPASDRPEDLAAFRVWWQTKMGGTRPLDVDRHYTLALFAARRCAYRDGLTRQTAAVLRAPCRKSLLSKIHCPALVIHGDADPLVPLSNGYHTARWLSNARLVVRPKMGHVVVQEDYEWIAEEIVELAARCEGVDGAEIRSAAVNERPPQPSPVGAKKLPRSQSPKTRPGSPRARRTLA